MNNKKYELTKIQQVHGSTRSFDSEIDHQQNNFIYGICDDFMKVDSESVKERIDSPFFTQQNLEKIRNKNGFKLLAQCVRRINSANASEFMGLIEDYSWSSTYMQNLDFVKDYTKEEGGVWMIKEDLVLCIAIEILDRIVNIKVLRDVFTCLWMHNYKPRYWSLAQIISKQSSCKLRNIEILFEFFSEQDKQDFGFIGQNYYSLSESGFINKPLDEQKRIIQEWTEQFKFPPPNWRDYTDKLNDPNESMTADEALDIFEMVHYLLGENYICNNDLIHLIHEMIRFVDSTRFPRVIVEKAFRIIEDIKESNIPVDFSVSDQYGWTCIEKCFVKHNLMKDQIIQNKPTMGSFFRQILFQWMFKSSVDRNQLVLTNKLSIQDFEQFIVSTCISCCDSYNQRYWDIVINNMFYGLIYLAGHKHNLAMVQDVIQVLAQTIWVLSRFDDADVMDRQIVQRIPLLKQSLIQIQQNPVSMERWRTSEFFTYMHQKANQIVKKIVLDIQQRMNVNIRQNIPDAPYFEQAFSQ